MTGSERITDKILAQSVATAQVHTLDAAREVEQILAEATALRATADAEADRRTAVMVREVEQRSEAILQLELRKRDLTIRQQLVDQAFVQSQTALATLPDSTYRKLVAEMILSTDWVGDAELVVNEQDQVRLGAALLQEVDALRAQRGLSGKTRFAAEPLPQAGGFVVRNGDMEINGTLAVVLAGLRPSLEGEVVKTLFEGLR